MAEAALAPGSVGAPPDPDGRRLALAEEALVRGTLRHPGELALGEESALRQAFGLARLAERCGAHDARALAAFRRTSLATAHALFGELADPADGWREPRPELLRAAARRLAPLTAAAYASTARPEAWEHSLRHRELVLALGGGGGVAYDYLGCFDLLEEWGLRPALIAGTSHGAIVGLFRARALIYRPEDLAGVLDSLSFKKLFRFFRVRSQYALPGPLQLYLRSALLPVLEQLAARQAAAADPPGAATGLTLRAPGTTHAMLHFDDLPIPLVVCAAGVRAGMLPRPPKEYERLFDLRSLLPPTPRRLQRRALDLFTVLGEFVRQPNRLDALYLGSDPGTREIDVLDAIGFSCSLPGFIHYDVLRPDPRAHAAIRHLLAQRELGWLADGGLVENCPARAAHRAFERLTAPNETPRNGFVLALDAFSPTLTTAPWLPIQRLAQETVRRVLPFADLCLPFPRTLSPLSVLPNSDQVARATVFGRARLAPEMPFLARMLTPLPPLEETRHIG